MTEDEYLAATCAFTHFGPARVKLLLSFFGSARKIWSGSEKELIEIGLSHALVNKFLKHRNFFNPEKYFANLKSLGIKFVKISDDDYPQNLKEIPDAPVILYVRGSLKSFDSNSIAIVGSRTMTTYGREVTDKFGTELANFGITVISGLALGVDAEAQKSAFLAGGRTIAVLASGLDIISPLTNKNLALEIIKKGKGAVVSEYPLGYMPFKTNFAVRNRLIAGLSKAVIVVEGRKKSGTFYTVNAALSQGKQVFAVPGPITSPTSEGTNYLIQNGAKLITGVKDVLDELHMQLKVDRGTIEKILPGNKTEAKILEILELEPRHLDEVVRISGLTTSDISARLTIMEMKGLIRNLGQGIYQKI